MTLIGTELEQALSALCFAWAFVGVIKGLHAALRMIGIIGERR